MNSVVISMVVIPGVVSVLLFLIFTYLYEQSRQAYFSAWQLAWAAYSLHYVLHAVSFYRAPAPLAFFASSLFLVAMALCIFVSTRLMRGPSHFRWYDAALAVAGIVLAWFNFQGHMVAGRFQEAAQPTVDLDLGIAAVLLYCSAVFYVNGHRRGSLAFKVLGFSLALWAVLMGAGQFRSLWGARFDSAANYLGPVPQMLLGIAMVMVLFENERNAVQENTLALSTLGVDPRRLLSADDLLPSMQSALDRLAGALSARRAI
ncbi:MAG: hypothetical protein WAU76_15860, partial [Candidatus Sulfotelmatobacter sp.]